MRPPRQYDPADAAAEAAREKAAALERFEASVQASKTAPTAADPKEQSEFMARLIQKVISNLLVTITNIHIRYEDTFSNAEARRSRLNARPAGGGGRGDMRRGKRGR